MIKEFSKGRTLVCRLPHGADLLAEIQAVCERENIRAAWIQAIGALSSLRFAFYDQREKTYGEKEPAGSYEILSLSGNISLKDGAVICHAHIVAGDDEGRAFGGHLVRGCTVFAAELVINELAGPALSRVKDEVTGLNLWAEN